MSVATTPRSQVLSNAAALYSLQGLNYVIPLLVLPFLVRTLGMEKYGLIALAQSFAQYFTILTDYGFNYSATRRIAHVKNDREATSRVFATVFTIKFLLMLVGAMVLTIIILTVPRFAGNALFYSIAYLAVVGNVLFPTWLFQGLERMKYISIASGIAKLLSAGALFLFVRHPEDYILALAIQSFGVLFAGVLGFVIAVSTIAIRLRFPSISELIESAQDGWHLFVSTAAVSMYTNTNVFLVGILAGDTQAGYFSAAEKLIRATQGLIAPLTQAIFPHINSLAKQSRDAALNFIYRMLRWLGWGTLVPCLCLLLFAHPLMIMYLGTGGENSVAVIRWIALLPFLIAISNILGVQTMVTFHLDKQFSQILLAAGVVNLFLSVPLVLHFGAAGAGASVLITETIVTVAMWVVLNRSGIVVWNAKGKLK